MKIQRVLALLAALILCLPACSGNKNETQAPVSAGPGQSAHPDGWAPPPYQARCDMERIYIESGGDAALEANINQILMDMDIPLYIAASLCTPSARTAYDADEDSGRENEFCWTLLRRVLNDYAPKDQVELGAQVKAARKVVEGYWDAWLKRNDGETLPDIPSSLADQIRLENGIYVMDPSDGIYPEVSLVTAYADTDPEGRSILSVFADVSREGLEEPLTVEIGLLRRGDGAYVLQSSSISTDEDLYTEYDVTTYHAAVYLPSEFVLKGQDNKSASFAAPNGLTVDIVEESFTSTLAERYESDSLKIPDLVVSFVSDNRLDYGIIWDDGTNLEYRLVRQMESGNLVRVQVTVPHAWTPDYYGLAESIFESFGAAPFPIDDVLALEDYVMAFQE